MKEAREAKDAEEMIESETRKKTNVASPCDARGSDPGTGTIAGAILIMLAAVMLSVIAAAGSLFIVQARARSAADLAALSSATSLWNGNGEPCAEAKRIVLAHKGRLESCRIDGEVVAVNVSVRTRVPLISRISRSARAGPVDCL
ncbi:Rv3654c family TadE-like protein [Bifidobacterium sp.]|nr:Rv3654c family TadE-like protein [Bifidobacterium sp.]MCI1224732.1 flp pilus-assembly TadE/G-like family protein [Bifidobacterium sp.]